jgi:hypothetical protein
MEESKNHEEEVLHSVSLLHGPLFLPSEKKELEMKKTKKSLCALKHVFLLILFIF